MITAHKIIKRLFFKNSKISYSQSGEDLIIDYVLKSRGIQFPTYLDVGAFDPYLYNNTLIFYKRGCRGINIEPNVAQYRKFIKERRGDLNLNIGVLHKKISLIYYMFDNPVLNTFSENEAKKIQEYGYKIIDKCEIPILTLQDILKKYTNDVFPDILSLDVEGFDFEIIQSIDFNRSSPIIICIETISYSESGHGVKSDEIIQFLYSKNYILYADTNINSIFVKKEFWIKS